MHSTAGLPAPPEGRQQIDRRDADRRREDWLAEVWAASGTRVLQLRGRTTRIAEDDDGGRARIIFSSPEDISPREVPEAAVYLGAVGECVHVVAVPAEGEDSGEQDSGRNGRPGETWADLRTAGTQLGDLDAGLFTQALAVTLWHASAPFCAQCGHLTQVRHSGWMRHCPGCGAESFPRTDPAVITAVVDQQDRLLLGSAVAWDPRRFSTFAGFVEAGESLEDAIVREVQEEAGVTVDSVEYIGSQAWPFPRSLMLGFLAHTSAVQATADEEEIREVRWFTRKSLHDDVVSGAVVLPPRSAVSHALITHWYGTALPDGPATSDPEPAGRAQSA